MAGLAALQTGTAAIGDEPSGSPQQGFERDKRESLKNLLADLAGPSAQLREVAKRRFADGSSPERDIVFSLLQEGNKPELVKLAVIAAGQLRLRSAVPLLGKLLSHPSPDVSNEAARSLGAIGDPGALEFLLARSEQLDAELRTIEPALAGRDEEPPLNSARREQPSTTKKEGIGALADGVTKFEEMIGPETQLGFENFSPSHSPLSRILPPLAAENYRLLDRYTPYKLEKLEESAIIDVLINIAQAEDELTSNRYYAIKNLAYFRRIGLVKEVAEFLAADQPAIRYAAADTIAQLGGSAGATALLRAIEDTNPYVRSAAASGLAILGDDRGLVPLMALRDDPDEVVRFTAERSLQELKKRKDVGALLTRSPASTR